MECEVYIVDMKYGPNAMYRDHVLVLHDKNIVDGFIKTIKRKADEIYSDNEDENNRSVSVHWLGCDVTIVIEKSVQFFKD